MTFFEYPYSVVDSLVELDGVPMLSVREIAATKAFSIGKRMSYKDYVDWYIVLSENLVTIAEIISLSQKKYGGDFNDRLFLGQLASFEEVREVPIDWLREPVERDTIEEFLDDAVKKYIAV